MGVSLSAQLSSLGTSLLLGFCAGMLYDALRALRLRRRRSRTWGSFLDIVYCLTLALFFLSFTLRLGDGELRLYILLFAFCGGGVYFLIFSSLLQSFWRFLADTFFSLLRILRLPIQRLFFFYGKLTKLCKRLFLFWRAGFIIKISEPAGARRRRHRGRKAKT